MLLDDESDLRAGCHGILDQALGKRHAGFVAPQMDAQGFEPPQQALDATTGVAARLQVDEEDGVRQGQDQDQDWEAWEDEEWALV